MSRVTPESTPEVASLIEEARRTKEPLWFSGSGTTEIPDDNAVVGTERLAGIVDYRPDDLTIVVRAGTTLAELDDTLSEYRHTAVLPETARDRTVGGVVASGASGFRRLRYGPTRDRVIGVTLVTGYGEVVHAGGQLVKNVTGYDIPRLVTGSHGALGLIAEIYLKLWPVPESRRTVAVNDIAQARDRTYQPAATLETEQGGFVYVSGTAASVGAQIDSLEGLATEGFAWPGPLGDNIVAAINVPPRLVPEAVSRVRDVGASRFVAQHGVGVVDVGWSDIDVAQVGELRSWAETNGGSVVLHRPGPLGVGVSRWGTAPGTIAIQRRLKYLFDPDGVCNPGVLAGDV